MAKNLEIEAKGKLSKRDYLKILSFYPNAKFQYQTNFYIDNKKFEISENYLGLRIRKEKDSVELTLKQNLDEGRLEINQKISPNEFDEFLCNNVFPQGEVIRFLQLNYPKIAGNFAIFGVLNNKRLTIEFEGSEIAVDAMKYFDIEEYEIECESSSQKLAVETLKKFLSQYKIRYQKNSINKLERVLNIVR